MCDIKNLKPGDIIRRDFYHLYRFSEVEVLYYYVCKVTGFSKDSSSYTIALYYKHSNGNYSIEEINGYNLQEHWFQDDRINFFLYRKGKIVEEKLNYDNSGRKYDL